MSWALHEDVADHAGELEAAVTLLRRTADQLEARQGVAPLAIGVARRHTDRGIRLEVTVWER